jgi:hypothetical protein
MNSVLLDALAMTAAPKLQSIKEFRRQRIAALLDKYGKTKLSQLVDIPANYLWQMGRGVGKSARGVSDEKAAKIEAKLEKETGWMDPDQTAAHSDSQTVRLDATMVRQVAMALENRYKKVGGYSLRDRPEDFVIAYEIRYGMTDAYVSPEVFNLIIQHADLSPQGASADGRGSDSASTDGPSGGKARTGRGSEA